MHRTLFEADHEAYRETVRAFLAREIEPHYEEWESERLIDRSTWLAAGKSGLVGSVYLRNTMDKGCVTTGSGMSSRRKSPVPEPPHSDRDCTPPAWAPHRCYRRSDSSLTRLPCAALAKPLNGWSIGSPARACRADAQTNTDNGTYDRAQNNSEEKS